VEKILLKPTEAAQVLGIGRSLIYELIAQRKIPSVRLGRCLRIPTVSLNAWLKMEENQRQDSGHQADGTAAALLK
jgi:excisionase family DNA binding protein